MNKNTKPMVKGVAMTREMNERVQQLADERLWSFSQAVRVLVTEALDARERDAEAKAA